MSQGEQEGLPEIHLQDVTEDETLTVAPPSPSRKKKWLMIGGLLALLLVTAVSGYFLLHGKEVNVKAIRNTPERITSGSDLQQAAYDSLRGSLSNLPTVSAPQNPAANIGSNQSTTIAMAGVSPVPTPNSGAAPKPSASIQSGIAMTIAPPPELAANNARAKPVTLGSQPAALSTDTKVIANTNIASVSKPKTDASIAFADLPIKQIEKIDNSIKVNDGDNQSSSTKALTPLPEKSVSSLPSFGAMLPVRLLGMLYTFRTGTLARLELLRDSKTDHWHLPRGTIFVGTVQGAGRDRAYIQIKGFIDPATDRFTKLEGETLGSDGATGIRGKERRLSSVWLRVLDRAAQTGTQLLTSILGRSGSQVIIAADPAGLYRSATNNESSSLQNNRSFVEVPAGTAGFVLVTTLPAAAPAPIAPAMTNESMPSTLTDADLADLFSTSDRARIRAALPRMSVEVRRALEQALREMEH